MYYSDDAMSDDAATFVSIADDLPNVPVYSILISRVKSDIVLAGTEFGVWSYSLSTGGVWNSENAVVGNVPIFDIKKTGSVPPDVMPFTLVHMAVAIGGAFP